MGGLQTLSLSLINENKERDKQNEQEDDAPTEIAHERDCLNLPRKPQIHVMCFIGKQESGKSHLIKSILL